jgi:hypothetical protein
MPSSGRLCLNSCVLTRKQRHRISTLQRLKLGIKIAVSEAVLMMMRRQKCFWERRATHRLILIVLVCLICLGPISAQKAFPSVTGDYEGTLGSLHLRLHVWHSSPTALTGTMDSIDQHAFGVPCTELALSGVQFSFRSPVAHGSYKGEISADGNTITGTWTQGDSSPLVFTRIVQATSSAIGNPASSDNSQWVHFGPNKKLAYVTTPKGDRIPDFSSSGYRGGGIALPHVATRVKVSPRGEADDTPLIQAALDRVARLNPGVHEIRGAVELAPGTFHLKGTLHLNTSGVVLRGAGSEGPDATVLEMTGEPHLAIEIKGDFQWRELGSTTTLTDSYVPAGATLIHVANTSGIHRGDTLEIVKPVTPQWIHFMGMDHLVRNGKPEKWVKNDISVLRQVASVRGNAVKLTVPLTDSFDAQFYPGTQPPVTRGEITGRISETGIENLRIEAPNRSIAYRVDPEFDGIFINNVLDSWLSGLAFVDTTDSVRIDLHAERLTVVNVDVTQHSAVTTSAKPFDFSVQGTQILLDRCTGKGDKVVYIATQSRSEGPVVVLHCRFSGDGQIEGHQRWSTGLLVDSSIVQGGRIYLRNRGIMGSGHGWTIGWSVLWNDEADLFIVQKPPGDMNWAIGDKGGQEDAPMPDSTDGPYLPSGIIESIGKHIQPGSLYLEQLRERMGPAAIKAIGYPAD